MTIDTQETVLVNPMRSASAVPPPTAPDADAPRQFHRSMPGYEPSQLVDAPTAATAIGAASVRVKNETRRFGLPAFKILGASWATARAVQAELTARGLPAPPLSDGFAALVEAAAALNPMSLCCATDGNHGRAVAHMARLLGFSSRIFVPSDMAPARIEAIEGEGAEIIRLDGTYDDAIERSAGEASSSCLVISDTSWPGYSKIPQWVIDGYSTIFSELDEQLQGDEVDLVAIQIGVGALAAATAPFAQRHNATFVGVEPTVAACNLHSLEAGEITFLPGPHDSIMAGLNCGLPSEIAWPVVSSSLDIAIAASDARAEEAMRLLARDGIVAGETGAAGLAGLLAWTHDFGGDLAGQRIILVTTEGATDPAAYRRIVGED